MLGGPLVNKRARVKKKCSPYVKLFFFQLLLASFSLEGQASDYKAQAGPVFSGNVKFPRAAYFRARGGRTERGIKTSSI